MRKRGATVALPAFVAPCLAKLGSEPPVGDHWGHEIKFDGYRLEARIEGGQTKLLTRNGLDWTGRFGRLAGDIARLPLKTALIDGEAIVEDEHGRSDFPALVAALKSGRDERIVFVAFDLLFLDERDLTPLPLRERKALLKALLDRKGTYDALRYSDHIVGDGAKMLSEVCKLGLEGIVSKRLDAPYRSGRGEIWRKTKCFNADEFVVIGYLESAVEPKAIGALVLGYFKGKALRYAGRVGTGFNRRSAAALWQSLHKLRVAAPPTKDTLDATQRKGVRWVSPSLVAQIEYRGWTADGLLRHAAFKTLREDVPARSVKHP